MPLFTIVFTRKKGPTSSKYSNNIDEALDDIVKFEDENPGGVGELFEVGP